PRRPRHTRFPYTTLFRATVGIAGAGAFGTALASVLARSGRRVVLWSRRADIVDAIRTTRRSPRLPGAVLPEPLEATAELRRLARDGKSTRLNSSHGSIPY